MNFASPFALVQAAHEEAGSAYAALPSLAGRSTSPGEDTPKESTEAKFQPLQTRKHVRFPRAFSNVASVDLGTLAIEGTVSTGDPTFCGQCSAAFSNLSVLNDDRMWTCEFCGNEQEVFLDDEELPRTASVDYILEAPQTGEDTIEAVGSPLVVFALDCSGSMCVSTLLPNSMRGKFATERLFQRREEEARRLAAEFGFPGGYAPRQELYVSRLQCLQVAIESQINALTQASPNAQVALVTFSDDIKIYTAGNTAGVAARTKVLAGVVLQDQDAIVSAAKEVELGCAIRDSAKVLIDVLYSLEAHGQTALGPGVLCATSIGTMRPGSRVFVATDGLSNVGVGALENGEELARSFYDDVAHIASDGETTCSIISLPGEECDLDALGILADATQGDIDIVEPLNLVDEFANVLCSKLLGTKCSMKFMMPAGIVLDSIDGQSVERDSASTAVAPDAGRMYTHEVGNVFDDSAVSFGYIVTAASGDTAEQRDSLPFQVQISFKRAQGRSAGGRFLRVLTSKQRVTRNRDEAEQDLNYNILAAYHNTVSGTIASTGDYGGAVEYRTLTEGMMLRSPVVTEQQAQTISHYSSMTRTFNSTLEREQQRQREFGDTPEGVRSSDQTSATIHNFRSQRANQRVFSPQIQPSADESMPDADQVDA